MLQTRPVLGRYMPVLGFSILWLLVTSSANAQGSAFSYQGKLTDAGNPANGNYDLQFALWDSNGGGTQIGTTQTLNAVSVSAGIFTVQLDFGANAFSGPPRFLEISARLSGAPSFTTLLPRQQITSTPYAVRSLNASSADTVTVNGVPSGSGNYIQNATAQQAGANFNIGGNGTIGGNLGIGTSSTQAKLEIQTPAIVIQIPYGFVHSDDSSTTARTRLGSYILNPRLGFTRPFGAFFGTISDDDLNFFTNGGTKLTILKGGNVGIGTILPGAALSVVNSGAPEPTVNGVPAAVKIGSVAGTIPIALRQNVDEQNTPTLAWFETNSGGLGYFAANANKFIVGAATNKQLALRANGSSESLVIDTSGQVGIGTPSPAAKLDVRGNLTLDPGSNPILFTAASGGEQNRYLSLINSPTTQTASGLKAGGILVADSFGYANPGKNELVVQGKIRVGDLGINGDTALCRNPSNEIALCNISSLRYKMNIRPYTLGLDLISRLQPISFNWKQDGRADLGLAAEEVAKVAPSFTFTNSKGEIEGVRYDRLNVPLINAIKQQQEQIEILRAQNSALNARLRSVERIVKRKVGSARRRH